MLCAAQAMARQSKSEGVVLRFAKYYTPLVVATCVLLIVIPASMHKADLKVSLVCFAADLLRSAWMSPLAKW